MKHSICILCIIFCIIVNINYGKTQKYTADWNSLDSRPIPEWYDDVKFGIFVHWGVFSVPSYGCTSGGQGPAWYWNYLANDVECVVSFHNNAYGKDFKYTDFGPMFHANLFNPDDWANLFVESGAKYVVLTSKHHEGFTNWPSAESWNWNSVDTGPHMDIVQAVTKSIKNAGLRMGLYYSLYEWYNPFYLQDRDDNGNTTRYVDQIMLPQLYDIVNSYEPDVVWVDGEWEMNDTYWKSEEFLVWLYNESPVRSSVVTNDRWGRGDRCIHGGFYTCFDRYNPQNLQNHKWENCLTIDTTSWGFNRNSNISSYMTISTLLFELVSTVSCGGNLLLNVGPSIDGTIHPIFQERLLQMGSWLKVNGEAIYSTNPWRAQNDTNADTWYTLKNGTVYAIFLTWPKNNILTLTEPIITVDTSIEFLGIDNMNLNFNYYVNSVDIYLPNIPVSKLPSKYAWVLKLMNGY